MSNKFFRFCTSSNVGFGLQFTCVRATAPGDAEAPCAEARRRGLENYVQTDDQWANNGKHHNA